MHVLSESWLPNRWKFGRIISLNSKSLGSVRWASSFDIDIYGWVSEKKVFSKMMLLCWLLQSHQSKQISLCFQGHLRSQNTHFEGEHFCQKTRTFDSTVSFHWTLFKRLVVERAWVREFSQLIWHLLVHFSRFLVVWTNFLFEISNLLVAFLASWQ